MTFRDQDFQNENTIYRNVDHFAQWLASVLKTFDGSAQSLAAYLGDLAEAYAVSNEEYFEIRGFIQKAEIPKAIHSRSNINRTKTAKSSKI